ncbi:integrase [Streptosporangium canum]|uniref:integrase n=1 Tax=Streptosporangium canum TaxID=324952 RepID=UPI0036BB2F45
MQVTFATAPGGAAAPNEDWVGSTPNVVVVLDGVTVPSMMGTGCEHGTPWYVRQLGTHILAAVENAPATALTGLLATAISAVAALHEGACQLGHIGTPSAAVGILRRNAETIDYLLMADVTIVIDDGRGLLIFTDDRVEKTRRFSLQADDSPAARAANIATHRTRFRNQPGGYWVAASDPAAAMEAVTGSLPSSTGRRAALLTDGAACAVSPYELMDWEAALSLIEQNGPCALIDQVRRAELADPDSDRWPRYKVSDDATVALCLLP